MERLPYISPETKVDVNVVKASMTAADRGLSGPLKTRVRALQAAGYTVVPLGGASRLPGRPLDQELVHDAFLQARNAAPRI